MPRTARIGASGVLNHVMIRGIASIIFSRGSGESIAERGNYSLER
jgi:hypothetical protein